jgi:LPS-assembly protein
LVNELLINDPSLSESDYGLQDDRWAFSMINNTQINSYWSTSLNINKVSDRDYFRDLDVGLASKGSSYSQSQLQSRGDITYQDDIWTVSLYAQSTQSLVGDEPYRVIPSLISNAHYYHIDSGLYWQFESDFSYFTHRDLTQTEGSRFNVKQSVSYPMRNAYAWLTPKASYQISHYNYSQIDTTQTNLSQNLLTREESQLNRKLPIFSLDTGVFFDRDITWQQQDMTHSLEPRLFYVHIPFREQNDINIFDSRLPDFSFSQLWQENRFSGNDRIGDTDHVSFSVANRFVTNKKGEELLSFSIGQKHYFSDTRVFLETNNEINQESSSPWLVEMTYKPNAKIEVSGFIEWDDHSNTNSTNLARSQINYEPIEDHIVNLSHRLRNKNGLSNEELDLSFAWPINDEWRFVGRWYNDLKKGRTSESLFGVEYESCCFAARIVTRRYLDVRLDINGEPIFINPITGNNEEYNSGIQLQFEFKGLGSAGNDISHLLTKSIRGYQTRF